MVPNRGGLETLEEKSREYVIGVLLSGALCHTTTLRTFRKEQSHVD